MTYTELREAWRASRSRLLSTTRTDATRRGYGVALQQFEQHWEATLEDLRPAAESWISKLCANGAAANTVNLRASVLRQMAADFPALEGLAGIRSGGAARLGVWLSKAQLGELLDLPNTATLAGLRDRALVASLSLCGLRREEAVSLTWSQLATVETPSGLRHLWKDVHGKGSKRRHVPMSKVAAGIIADWHQVWQRDSGREDGCVFCRIRSGDRPCFDAGITGRAAAKIVNGYAQEAGYKLAPHDLRRTFGKLATRNGATLRAVMQAYGHAHLSTTERYLSTELELDNPATDYV